jgi:hypothetical protein
MIEVLSQYGHGQPPLDGEPIACWPEPGRLTFAVYYRGKLLCADGSRDPMPHGAVWTTLPVRAR